VHGREAIELLSLRWKLAELVGPLVLGRVGVDLHERILGSPVLRRAGACRDERAACQQKEPPPIHDLMVRSRIATSSENGVLIFDGRRRVAGLS